MTGFVRGFVEQQPVDRIFPIMRVQLSQWQRADGQNGLWQAQSGDLFDREYCGWIGRVSHAMVIRIAAYREAGDSFAVTPVNR
jgi:hypothetical protein